MVNETTPAAFANNQGANGQETNQQPTRKRSHVQMDAIVRKRSQVQHHDNHPLPTRKRSQIQVNHPAAEFQGVYVCNFKHFYYSSMSIP